MEETPRKYLRIRTVDRVLLRNGVSNAKIFYSPIGWGCAYALMLVSLGFPILLGLWQTVLPLFLWLSLGYFVSVLLVNFYFNNSFALTPMELVIVNPYFPFRKVKRIRRSDILACKIGESRWRWPAIFGAAVEQYLQINTKNGIYRFYCSGLEGFTHDQPFYENNIDDLHWAISTRSEEAS